jgi:hypothetical protein
MPELLSQFSAFTVFLAIAAFGFVFLLVSLVFGEVFDHLGGGFDHDMDHGGPSFLSPRILSVFITAFGGTGAVATHYGLSTLGSSFAGFVSGVLFGSIIYMFAKFLYSQQASTTVNTTDFAGRPARVVVSIPCNGVGQVRCIIGEEMIDKMARSKTGEAISENTVVRVEQVLGEIVIVHPQ